MTDINEQEITPQQLLERALELLDDVQHKLGMFENQRYWSIKLKAREMNFIREVECYSVQANPCKGF